MRVLRFRAVYIAPILAGTKTTTLRRPRSGLPERGDDVSMRCRYDRPQFAVARVTSTDTVSVRNLTDRIARADGFTDAAALRAAIRTDYPDATSFVVIRFRLID